MEELLDAVAAGKGGVVAISGEPGIGKSALLRKALELARLRGVLTLTGRAAEFERDLPFAVFAGALGQLPARTREEAAATLDQGARRALARLLPALGDDEAEPVGALPDERYRLLEAFHALLERLGGGRPLALALDDLHWADSASIDLLCRLLHRGMSRASLLLLAARPAQTEPRLWTALDEAHRHGRVRQVELAPLPPAAAAELAAEVADPRTRAWILRESGGNPFYIEQLLVGSPAPAATPAREALPAVGVPGAIRASIGVEVSTLTPSARALLRGAAALGDPFDFGLAVEAAGIPEAQALVALDLLLARGLISESAASKSQFRFRHPIVRHAVYEETGLGWRMSAHRRALAALRARGATAASLAPHLERAAKRGDRLAVATLTRAGEETLTHAPTNAAHWFEVALALTDGPPDADERIGLLALHATALGLGGRVDESRAALGRFLKIAPKAPSDARLHATVLAANLDCVQGDPRSARRMLTEELARLPDKGGADAARLERELSFAAFFDGDVDGMREWSSRALSASGDALTRVGTLAALAVASISLGEPARARELAAEAGALLDSVSDDELAAEHPGSVIMLAWADVCTERFDSAIGHTSRSIAISRALGQLHLIVGLMVVRGQALWVRGRGVELAAEAEQALELALLWPSQLFLSWALALRCHSCAQAGQLYEALRCGERAVIAAEGAMSPFAGIARVHYAYALLEAGEPESCRRQLVGAPTTSEAPVVNTPFYEVFCLELLARSALGVGALVDAKELTARAEQRAEQLGFMLPLAQARRTRATLLLAERDSAGALAAALASFEAAESAGAPVEAARARVLAGRALAANGDRGAAVSQLEAAHGTFVGSGAFHYGAEAARELRGLGRAIATSASGARSSPAPLGLSRREAEVMEGVAGGKTNRAIAEDLFLSVRTVDRHVARIFQKLRVNTRAAAATKFERARAR